MSLDVLLSYIYGDSIARKFYQVPFNNMLNGIGYSDTLRYAAKYLYEIDDYNPIKFYTWCTTDPTHRYYKPLPFGTIGMISPSTITSGLLQQISKTFPDSGKTAFLCSSNYIADVEVNYTVEGADTPTTGRIIPLAKVTCTVLDTIKGQVLPNCIPDPGVPEVIKHEGEKIASGLGGCLQFEYIIDLARWGNWVKPDSTNKLGDMTTGARWIQPDSEYIVFLNFMYERSTSDTSHVYAACQPMHNMHEGGVHGMYPVRGGIVYDPTNDFGFGTGLTVAQWKEALRAKIYSITHP